MYARLKPLLLILVISLGALWGALSWAAASKRQAPSFELKVSAEDLSFEGERAFEFVEALAVGFPYRHSGAVNNRLAASWLLEQFKGLGLEAYRDDFPTVLYSRPAPMTNVVGVKRGGTREAIVVVAHYDQATTTVQGADNDASGVGITLHLAEIFAPEETYYTLIFLISDGEEYGMLGAKRFIDTYPRPDEIIAAVSLDNIGRYNAYGLGIAPIGQGKGYTDLWLVRLTQQIAEEAGLWRPTFPDPVTQVLERAVLISFTDQGPFLTRGVPALGLGAHAEAWPYYHLPTDTIDRIGPATLEQAGKLTEAVIRELNLREAAPPAQQDYLYLDRPAGGLFVPGLPLAAVRAALLVPLVLAAAYYYNRARGAGKGAIKFLPHALVNAIPPLAGLLSLYLLNAAALFPQFTFYPAPPLDPILYRPRYFGILLFAAAVVLGAFLARYLRRRRLPPLDPASAKAAALLLLTVVAAAILIKNGYALVFILPAIFFWPFLPGCFPKSKAGKITSLVLFFAGGAAIFLLLYQYGLRIQLGGYILWYLLLMLSLRMTAPYTALAACLVIGSGLTLLGVGVKAAAAGEDNSASGSAGTGGGGGNERGRPAAARR